uniref:Integrase, catalytic region n=1 Tax=Leptospirillum ferrodiazotrophum TaxID=412449 RepID=C6HXC7_9BACT|nr:MAG: Integrase, catalytic region [Leptospirillum ferrodiazotrophum]
MKASISPRNPPFTGFSGNGEQLARRGRARVPTHRRPTPLCATAPNQVWTWDITYLSTTIKGQFFYLYLFLDLYSRKIVGWEVWASESADHAADTLKKAVLRETQGGHAPRVVLHSDNGAPMKGATMLGMLQKLRICPSFGHPSVSNDNADSESLFKTIKYRPNYPVDRPFDALEEARQWVASFVRWYNDHHRHSALKFVTPSQRHRGEDRDLLQHRTQVYQSAQQRNPERWSGNTRNWSPIEAVFLNPQREQKEKGHSSKSQTSKNVRQIA